MGNERRQYPRYLLDFHPAEQRICTLHIPRLDLNLPLTMVDISAGGLSLFSHDPLDAHGLTPGEAIAIRNCALDELARPLRNRPGVIAWAKSRRLGLKFDHTLLDNLEDLLEIAPTI